MAERKLSASTNGKVKDATKYKIAVGGVVKPIERAFCAKDGVVRQYWPPDEPLTCDPNDISDLVLHLDSSVIGSLYQQQGLQPFGLGSDPVTADGQDVQCWADLSPNGYHMNLYKPEAPEGYGAGEYDGGGGPGGEGVVKGSVPTYLGATDSVLTSTMNTTVLFVALIRAGTFSFSPIFGNALDGNHPGTAGVPYFFSCMDAVGGTVPAGLGVNFLTDTQQLADHGGLVSVDEWHQGTTIIGGSTMRARVDGSGGPAVPITGVLTGGNEGTSIFDNTLVGTNHVGSIAEVLVYDRELTTEEITHLEDCLKAKWGTP